ncbi:MAG: hypothetical protein AMXMBFR84_41240 [Candidatus Hydrogenedentota bacterium]
MRNILTIVRRDLGQYFTSPVGYIFIIVFLLISVGLYMTSFFVFPVADMRQFFGNLPVILCIFVPAVTMRVWAEERKENTWEMLLTFPMKASQLVLGKFFATLLFFAITLAATFTVPLMLVVLGNPDNGALLTGYFGTLLLGSFFLSLGIFCSGFCKDQIVAFVLTLLGCFLLFLVGTNFIAGLIDGYVPGLGSTLSELLGVLNRYTTFTRGVVEVGDVVFFVAWTAILLGLNIMFIDGRNRPGGKTLFATAVALCFAIGLAFNWLASDQSLGRFDLTEDKVFTVSPATKNILDGLDAPVQVKLYITPASKMPTELKQLEQDITDKLDELRMASGGKLQYSAVYLEAANIVGTDLAQPGDTEKAEEPDEKKAIEERMLDKGVTPFSVQVLADDQFSQSLIYSSIGIGYKDKKEEIIPQVEPNSIPELEYRVINTVYKISRETAPKIVLVAPKETYNIDPQLRQMLMQMGQDVPQEQDPYSLLQRLLEAEKYTVERVALTKEEPLPAEFDTLVVVNPRSLNERQKWELNRALASGKNVVLAVQHYEWQYQATRSGINLVKNDQTPMVNDWLTKYGLGVDEKILMDVNHVSLTIGSQMDQLFGGSQRINLPIQILVNTGSMAKDEAITSRLSSIFYLWGTALSVKEDELKKYNLAYKPLIWTSERAWTADAAGPISQSTFDEPASGQQYPLVALVSGTFPDVYKDGPRPAWPETPQQPGMPPMPPSPEEEGPAPALTPKPGKLILMGCAQTFRDNFIQQGNADLFLNSVDALTLGNDIVNVRGKKPLDRSIDRPTDTQRRTWQVVNYAAVSLLLAIVGIVVAVARRQARNAYTMSYASKVSN